MTFSDDVLMAYADGELDAQTRAQVEDAIVAEPEVATTRRGARRDSSNCAFRLREGARRAGAGASHRARTHSSRRKACRAAPIPFKPDAVSEEYVATLGRSGRQFPVWGNRVAARFAALYAGAGQRARRPNGCVRDTRAGALEPTRRRSNRAIRRAHRCQLSFEERPVLPYVPISATERPRRVGLP